MFSVLNENKALDVLSRYYGQLKLTGYVKETTVKRMLVYLFLIDFIENTFWHLEEEDYYMLSQLLRKLFSDGDCLFPYPVFCTNRVVLGKDGGPMHARLRITEDETVDTDDNDVANFDRITEDDELRAEVL